MVEQPVCKEPQENGLLPIFPNFRAGAGCTGAGSGCIPTLLALLLKKLHWMNRFFYLLMQGFGLMRPGPCKGGLLALLVVLVAQMSKAQNRYPYGIAPLSTLEAYRALVQKDSSMALVPLQRAVPGIRLDIRYATTRNFMGQPVYGQAAAYLSLPAARALQGVQEELAALGYGLKVFDAYRPYAVTVAFYEKVRDTVFVASPYRGSRHNRGCAVDLTLVHLPTGRELPMPTGFDDFSPRAHTDYGRLPKKVKRNRELLKRVMTRHGFAPYPDEWWHFDYRGWQSHPLLDLSFEQLAQAVH